jgi:hypothetical protein
LTSQLSRDLIIAGHQQIAREWWGSRKKGFDIYLSQLVIDEVRMGDAEAARERLKAIRHLPLLGITQEVTDLAARIISLQVLSRKRREPMLLTSQSHPSMACSS